MPDYDFSTLNSSDLEELACDLMNLNVPEGSIIKYKTFKDGQDQGIDFLYSTDNNDHEHVGQVKHFYRTGYSGMLSKLKSEEVDKVKKLNPNKYIFFTSVDLSTAQTKELKNTFTPFIKSLNDIYGKKGINKLIVANPKILEMHFKLWLSDFEILKKIISSDLEFRSSDFMTEIKQRLKMFVKTSILDRAKLSLETNKFVIITGQPGVGKTTLAEILAYEYIAKNYKLNYIIEDIKEMEQVLVPDDTKQIIYFDDFLGSNFEQINKSKGSESRLINILKRLPRLENKLLILTTRSLILNSVIEESQHLERYGLISKTNSLELSEYDVELKKEIYNNHIEVADIDDDFKKILLKESVKNFVVNHTNYAPRSVEYITSKFAIERTTVADFESFIKENFNYPDEIWRKAYTYQIKKEDRLLLSTLFSFNKTPSLDELEEAFASRIHEEILTNNYSKEVNAFKTSLRRIDGGMILIKKNKVSFINPSLKDFLIKFLKEDKDEMNRIVNSIVFITQFSEQLFESVDYTPNISEDLKSKLLEDYESFIREDYIYRDTDLIQLVIVINKHLSDDKEAENVTIEILNKIDDWQSLHDNYELNIQFGKFIDLIKNNYNVMDAIKESSLEIVNDLVMGENDIAKSIEILSKLKDTFQLDFSSGYFPELHNHFDQLFMELIDNEIEWLNDFITDESEAHEKKLEIQDLADELNNIEFDYTPDLSEFNKDWFEIAMHNEFKRQMEKDD